MVLPLNVRLVSEVILFIHLLSQVNAARLVGHSFMCRQKVVERIKLSLIHRLHILDCGGGGGGHFNIKVILKGLH